MKKRKWLHKRLPLVALLLSLLLFVLSMASNNAGNDTDRVAEKVSRRIERRLEILKQYSLMALDTDRERFIGSTSAASEPSPFVISGIPKIAEPAYTIEESTESTESANNLP